MGKIKDLEKLAKEAQDLGVPASDLLESESYCKKQADKASLNKVKVLVSCTTNEWADLVADAEKKKKRRY